MTRERSMFDPAQTPVGGDGGVVTKKPLILHPLLLASFPVLFLYAHNIREFTIGVVLVPLAIILGATMLLWVVIGAALRNFRKAAGIVSLLVAVFFAYGHIYDLISSFRVGLFGKTFGPNAILLPIASLLVIIGVFLLIRTRRELVSFTKILNACSVGLVGITLITIIPQEIRRLWSDGATDLPVVEPIVVDAAEAASYPNIYYIILDGYARADILKELYDHDNAPFLDALRQKGFFVATKARTNYRRTVLSVPSTLNYDYLDKLLKNVGPESKDLSQVIRLSKTSKAVHFLKSRGYRIVLFHSGYASIEQVQHDIYSSDSLAMNEFEQGLLETTVLAHVTSPFRGGDAYKVWARRNDVRNTLDHLADTCELDGPIFVLAHIVSPHEPLIFGANGEPTDYGYGERYTEAEYIMGYRNQLIYISKRIIEIVADILNRSSRPPVIVLAADHGPSPLGVELDKAEKSPRALKQKFSILNAYYLPDDGKELLYDEISPVNTFRVIFNHCFGTKLQLLADRSFYSEDSQPFKFVDVTDIIERADKPQQQE